MTSVAPEPHDFDDTVAHPPRRGEPIVERSADLDDTITVQRAGISAGIPMSIPERIPEPAPISEPVVIEQGVPLVEPPTSRAPELPTTNPPPSARPEFSGNVWSEQPPERTSFLVKLDDGTLVPLDEPVYLGRKPSVPRIHPGGTPLLITLDSPQREVSSTHLGLTTVGGTIVASDMKSTNGSVLHVPGAPPRILLGGESAVVAPGTIIELGDGNRVELLGPDPDAHIPSSTGAPQ